MDDIQEREKVTVSVCLSPFDPNPGPLSTQRPTARTTKLYEETLIGRPSTPAFPFDGKQSIHIAN